MENVIDRAMFKVKHFGVSLYIFENFLRNVSNFPAFSFILCVLWVFLVKFIELLLHE